MATSAPAPAVSTQLGKPAKPKVVAIALSQTQIATAIAIVVAHIILAIVMRAYRPIATAHAIATVFVAVLYCATTRRLRTISVAAAYIIGCEVLWRMSKADVFWEIGKYAAAAVLLGGLLRMRWPRNRILPIVYFALLLPSVPLTWIALSPEDARQAVSFNLSGPLALTLAVLYFSNVRHTRKQLLTTFFALLAPILGIATLSFLSTLKQSDIEFVNASSAATSGGYAANQVSAMLGLGVLLLLLVSMDRRLPWRVRIPLFALAAALAAQTMLTFARGGIVLALAGTAGALLFLLRNRRGRASVVVFTILGGLIGRFVIVPRLESVTKGELAVRYTDSSSTGRDLFIASELELFSENPIVGVGPGVGMTIRAERGLFEGASHTEYSRMLGEHGLLGAFALICLIALAIRAVRQATTRDERALSMAMVMWTLLFMLVYGTRLAAPSLVFGLAFLRLQVPKPASPATRSARS